MQTDPCPEPARLAAFLDGVLPAAEVSALEAHLAACGDCREAAGEPLPPMPEGWVSPASVRLAGPGPGEARPASLLVFRRRWTAVAAGLALAVGALWALPGLRGPAPVPAPAPPEAPDPSGISRVLLGGDVLTTLDRGTRVQPAGDRALWLVSGSAAFEASPLSPVFQVRTPEGVVEAAGGAAFGLRRTEPPAREASLLLPSAEAADPARIDGWVLSGAVRWIPASGPPVTIPAGHRWSADGAAPLEDRPGVERALAWRLRGTGTPGWTFHGRVLPESGTDGAFRLRPGPCAALLAPPPSEAYGFEATVQCADSNARAGIAVQVGDRNAVWLPALPAGREARIRVLVGGGEVVVGVEGGEGRRLPSDALRSNLLPPGPGVGVSAWDGEVLVRDVRLFRIGGIPPSGPNP